MSPLYPAEPKKLDIISHLEELRKRILFSLLILSVFTIFSFAKGDEILAILRKPLNGLIQELIYIGPTEAFIAYFKISLLAGFIVSFPVFLYQFWAFIAPAFGKNTQKRVTAWLVLAFFLFLAGISFAYFLAIPIALRFLINFGREIASPHITLERYISFVVALILVGGVVFEIPVLTGLLTDIGLLNSKVLKNKRAHAYIIILISAALITPTQDIMNMLLFAFPMAILYEFGVLLAGFIEKKRLFKDRG
jgi:sec-independent protein translocase protein TatC